MNPAVGAAYLLYVALASASVVTSHPLWQHKKHKPSKPSGPKGELLFDGEEVFCSQLDDEEQPACKQAWHSTLTMTCGPTCHSYDAQQQVGKLEHFAAYYAEDCDLRSETSCLAACISNQLLGDGDFNAAQGHGFVDTLNNAFGGSSEVDSARWLNVSDPVVVTDLNISVLGVNATRNASKLLHSFWAGLCSGGKLSAEAERLCPESFKDPGRNIHFSYLDGPKAGFLQKSMPTRLDQYLQPSRALPQTQVAHSSDQGAASESKAYRTSVLRRASRSGTASDVEISSVRRWLEAAALRQSKRSALCQYPRYAQYPQYRPYRAGSIPDPAYQKPNPLPMQPAPPPTYAPPPPPVVDTLPELPAMGVQHLPTLGPPGGGVPGTVPMSPHMQKLNDYLARTPMYR